MAWYIVDKLSLERGPLAAFDGTQSWEMRADAYTALDGIMSWTDPRPVGGIFKPGDPVGRFVITQHPEKYI